MAQTHGEVGYGATFRIGKVLPQPQASTDTMVKWVSNKVINIGLVTLPLDSGPKSPVG